MRNLENITCMVNARIASTRVPRKMVRPFADSCLLEIALQKLASCEFLNKDNLFLGAYDQEIKDVGDKLGINIYERTYESTLEPVTMDIIYKWLWDIDTEYVLEINPCNPLLERETISKALETFSNSEYESLFSVVARKNFFFDNDSNLLNKFSGDQKYLPTLETKMVEPIFEAAHCIYIWKSERVREEGVRWSLKKDDPYLFEIEPEEAFDIDYPWQFELAEIIYKKRYGVVESPI